MKMNYKNLKQWIYNNPRVATLTNFSNALGVKKQNISYYICKKRLMPKDLIDKAQVVFNLHDDQVDEFFYLTYGCKKRQQ